ncbi:MAG: hypothetical protein Q9181_007959 [Wetmoreana brouardii]
MSGRGRGQVRAPPGTWPPADAWGYPDIAPRDEDRWLNMRPTNPRASAAGPASGQPSTRRRRSTRGSTSTQGRGSDRGQPPTRGGSPAQGSTSIQGRGPARALGEIPAPGYAPTQGRGSMHSASSHQGATQTRGDIPAPGYAPAEQEPQNSSGIAHIPFARYPWPSRPLRPGDRVPSDFLHEARNHHDPVVFSWNEPSTHELPTNHAANIAWYQGPTREWIAFDTHNGTVRFDIRPFLLTRSIATHAPPTDEPAFEFRGYGAESEPFMPFFRAGLVPHDRNLRIRWVLEDRRFYRARRISIGEPDDSVVPNLYVEGHPHLTVQQYLATRQRFTHTSRSTSLHQYQQESQNVLRNTEQRLNAIELSNQTTVRLSEPATSQRREEIVARSQAIRDRMQLRSRGGQQQADDVRVSRASDGMTSDIVGSEEDENEDGE